MSLMRRRERKGNKIMLRGNRFRKVKKYNTLSPKTPESCKRKIKKQLSLKLQLKSKMKKKLMEQALEESEAYSV